MARTVKRTTRSTRDKPGAAGQESGHRDPSRLVEGYRFLEPVPPARAPEGDADAVELLEHVAGMMQATARLLRMASPVLLMRAPPPPPPRFTKPEAKAAMVAELGRVRELVDASGLSNARKVEARRAIDEAIRKIGTCKNPDLEQVDDILGPIRRQLEADPTGDPPTAVDAQRAAISTGLGAVETLATLIKIKDNWPFIASVTTRRGTPPDTKCYVVVTAKNNPITDNPLAPPTSIPVNCARMDEVTALLDALTAKLDRCDYPSVDDARRFWELLDRSD